MADANIYPKAKYHASRGTAVVNDPEQEAALGNEWFDDPGLKIQPNLPKPVFRDETPQEEKAREVAEEKEEKEEDVQPKEVHPKVQSKPKR